MILNLIILKNQIYISELSKKIEINNRLNKNIVYNTYMKGLKNLGTTCYINTII